MEQKLIIPLAPNDFRTMELKIGINQDKFCRICDGVLKTSSEGIFSAGIFYICQYCGKKFKKTTYRDFRTQQDYFQLEEVMGAC